MGAVGVKKLSKARLAREVPFTSRMIFLDFVGLMNQPAPSRTRYWVIVFAVTLAVITYVDRVCISKAAPLIQQDLGLTKQQMGYAFAAFGWAYALFEIPGGWLGDVIGPRKVLMRVVVMWSIFTAARG
jgi:MFS family permease